jgi:allantoinase
MSAARQAIKSTRILAPDGIKAGFLVLEGDVIGGVVETAPAGIEVLDVGDAVVMPGLVDSHVHLNEPGRTEWEGFETGTRAAAAGGITTLAEMPLNSQPVTTTMDALTAKMNAARGQLSVDCCFYGGVIPGNAASLEPMIQAGVRGFKCFLIHSGIDDFPNATESDLHQAMPILARHNIPLLVHAELECADSAAADWSDKCCSYRAFLESRPRRWENDAINMMIRLCEQHKCPVHIVHLSSSDAIEPIRAAKKAGLPLTVETCPHYLTFCCEEIKDSDPRFKCAPPIRERENREKLWQAVIDGTIDFIVSDHSPCVPSLKFLEEGDLQKAWGGISGLQFVLPTVWTGAKQRGATIADITRWLSAAQSKFLGLTGKKGSFLPGADADIVVWSPEKETKIHSDMIHHRHKVTPYDGMKLMGQVEKTFLRGQLIYEQGKHSKHPVGQTLMREHAESKK